MVNFVPAWYQNGEWKRLEKYWYVKRTNTEMDDTVKQIQLFHRNNIRDYRILLLSYTPNFRHFLHRQGIFRAGYISVFDLIQEVDHRGSTMFSFRQLNWPEDIEFIYSPFVIVAMLYGEKYAQVEFDEDGRTIEIIFFSGDEIVRTNTYDDRGFLSVTSLYSEGKKVYDQYLTQSGVWKICYFLDGHVEINPGKNDYCVKGEDGDLYYEFKKLRYDSIEEVIGEVFKTQVSIFDKEDIFVVAAHKLHQKMVSRILNDKNTIYSLFEERYPLGKAGASFEDAQAIVCDSDTNYEKILKTNKSGIPVYNIPPYDIRIGESSSHTLHTQNILLTVDALSKVQIAKIIKVIAPYLKENDKAMVHLFTRNAKPGQDKYLLDIVREALKQEEYPESWCPYEGEEVKKSAGNEESHRFTIRQCVDELSVSKCVREQRVLVDLSDVPDMFLQIVCIGRGVPQLLKNEDEYMKNGSNGLVISDIRELPIGISFYLDNLSNWNKAQIASDDIQKQHATDTLVEKWREVIKGFEN